MNFEKLKELAKRIGGLLVLDGEKPELVILPYETYEKLTSLAQAGQVPSSAPSGTGFFGRQEQASRQNPISQQSAGPMKTAPANPDEERLIEELNKEIETLKEEIRMKEEAELVENQLI